MPPKRNIRLVLRTFARRMLEIFGLMELYANMRSRLDREVFNFRQNRLSSAQIEAIYRQEYHNRANYGMREDNGTGWESDANIKEAHARAILDVLPGLKKVLIGGCSSGMAVSAFRSLGCAAMGFDVSPDLEAMALPEARPYLVRGSMLNIPFGPQDGFDCLITTDVLEHVQLKFIDRMFQEMGRLNTRWMAHLINHTSIQPDHMTLKPLCWWEKKAAPYYRLRKDLAAPACANPRIYGLNGDPLHVYTFWERIDP